MLLIAGIQVTPTLIQVFTTKPGSLDTFQISYIDLLKSLALFVIMQLIRFIQLASCAVIHNKCGAMPKHNFKTVVIGTLTNFKSSFVCVMAMAARYGFRETRQEVGELILFHAVSQTILSDFINVPLVKYLVKKFELTNDNMFDNELLGDFLDQLD